VVLNHFSSMWMMLYISMNLGSCGSALRSNMETHHCSLSFLLSSVNKGFSVLEWRHSRPSLNHLCRVLFFTPIALARDHIVLLLCKGTPRTSDRSICILLRPQFFLHDLTSTSIPCARHCFTLRQRRRT
jgi:hypothetical protein